MAEDNSSIDLSLLSEGSSDEEDAACMGTTECAAHQPNASTSQPTAESDEVTAAPVQQGTAGWDSPTHDDNTRTRKKLLSKKKLKRLKEKHERRGIIYVSRIPPHMKPQKLRQLLSQYGEVGRIYCTPEDPLARKKRKQKGGNTGKNQWDAQCCNGCFRLCRLAQTYWFRSYTLPSSLSYSKTKAFAHCLTNMSTCPGKNFTEGWVEFEDKHIAKQVAAMLNGQPIGGRRRSAYHFDLWCLKYLPKFKWDHLTEEIAYEKAVREQRLAAELSAAKRERDFYLSRVDRAKGVKAMAERRASKGSSEGLSDKADHVALNTTHPQDASGQVANGRIEVLGVDSIADGEQQNQPVGGAGAGVVKRAFVRHYGQRRVKPDPVGPDAPELDDSVLNLVVARKKQKL